MEKFETVINPYWMHPYEPFYFARWTKNGKRFLAACVDHKINVNIESDGLAMMRGTAYHKPTKEDLPD